MTIAKRHIILLTSLLLCSLFTRAQLTDSIKKSLKQRPRFDFWLESRNSFVSGNRAEFRGVKIAAAFNKNLYIGGGLHFLKYNDANLKRFAKPVYITDSVGRVDTLQARLQLTYLSYFIEYVFYKTHKWEFSIPAQIGIGGSWYEYEHFGPQSLQRHMVILYEPSMSGEYMIFKWFGVGANIGFRLMIMKNKKIPERFTSPIYVFNANIHWGELYKVLFPKTKLAKRL